MRDPRQMIGLTVPQVVSDHGCDRLQGECPIEPAAILQCRHEMVQDFRGKGRGQFIARHANVSCWRVPNRWKVKSRIGRCA